MQYAIRYLRHMSKTRHVSVNYWKSVNKRSRALLYGDTDSGSVFLNYLSNTAILNMKRRVSKTRHASVNYWKSVNERAIVLLYQDIDSGFACFSYLSNTAFLNMKRSIKISVDLYPNSNALKSTLRPSE